MLSKESAMRAMPQCSVTGEGMKVPRHWYVARVQMNCERSMETRIKCLGVETFLPLKPEIRHWKDRTKKGFRNLIPMMVFCHMTHKELGLVNRLQGVYEMIKAPGSRVPAVIPDNQIATLKYMLGNWDDEISIEPPSVVKGDRVRIVRGQLHGIEGVCTAASDGKSRIVIAIDCLCNTVVRVSTNDIEIVNEKT